MYSITDVIPQSQILVRQQTEEVLVFVLNSAQVEHHIAVHDGKGCLLRLVCGFIVPQKTYHKTAVKG